MSSGWSEHDPELPALVAEELPVPAGVVVEVGDRPHGPGNSKSGAYVIIADAATPDRIARRPVSPVRRPAAADQAT